MKKNSILVVTSHFRPNVGGVETHLDDLVLALTKRGFRVVVSTYQPLVMKEKAPIHEKGENFDIYRLPWPGFNLVHSLFKFPALEFLYLVPGLFCQTLFLLLVHRDISVVHAQGLAPAFSALFLAKIFGKRAIVSSHNLYFFPKSGIYTNFSRAILSRFDVVLTLSQASKKELITLGVPKKRISPFRYWLNLGLFAGSDKTLVRKKLGLNKGFIVFFVGRLIETKGVNLVLEVAKELPKVEFIVGGSGVLEDDVKKFAQERGNLRYVGSLDQKKVRDYMNASDVVLAPSLVDEGYGRVAMEAIACGTPVIASDVGGLNEVVSREVGVLVKPNANSFKIAILQVKSDKKSLAKLRSKTISYAKKQFGEDNVERIISCYSP